MTETISSNWVEGALSRMSCNGLSQFELRALEVNQAVELIKAADPALIVEGPNSLGNLNNKIICGDGLTDTEYQWAKSEIARLELVLFNATNSQEEAAVELASHYVYAAGIHTWNDGSNTTGDIPITGLLATDVVLTTMHSRASNEDILTAAAATGQINIVLDHNGTNTTTKINYSVLRAMPAS
jgi:hypothetical protein